MRALRLVPQNDEQPVSEDDERVLEIADSDILCAEPAGESRPLVQLQYERLNVFLGQYLKVRRGETLVVSAPRSLDAGDLLDVEIAIEDLDRVVLHAQLLGRWPLPDSELAEVQLVAGRHTDRIVAPLVERALGARHTARLLGS